MLLLGCVTLILYKVYDRVYECYGFNNKQRLAVCGEGNIMYYIRHLLKKIK